MNNFIIILIIIIIIIFFLFYWTSGSFENFNNIRKDSVWGEEQCGPNSILKQIGDYKVCLPKTTCNSETCPPGLCTCINGVPVFNNGYEGIASYPKAMSTYYCELSSGGCHGVTQNRFPEVNAAEIADNFGLQLCDPSDANNNCVGIAASSPMVVGNSQLATDSEGKFVSLWGQGMTEYTGVCYEITGPSGKKAIVALTDRCGGYCTCKGSKPQECGPCVNAPDMKPNCPCVGTVPGMYDKCCGLGIYGCPNTEQACDWCSSNNHPHFDLDTNTYNHLADGQGENGSIVLQNVRPIKCMSPLNWPPASSGGGGYISCPTGTWDTGTTGPASGCNGEQYLMPGDPKWPNSTAATHWCCDPNINQEESNNNNNNNNTYVQCPGNISWDTGTTGPSSGCSSEQYLMPGDPRWPNSNKANHWCCLSG